jgi:hypothetical protein
MTLMKRIEAFVTWNGVELTEGQVMTIRVALNNLTVEPDDALGEGGVTIQK